MPLPWWPIQVPAHPRDDGFEIVADTSHPGLPPGTVVRWDRIAWAGGPIVVDQEGHAVRVGRRRVMLRASPTTRTRPTRRAAAWFATTQESFRISTPPKARRGRIFARIALIGDLLVLFLFPAYALFALGRDARPAPEVEIDQRVLTVLMVSMAVLGLLILSVIIHGVHQVARLRRAWWATAISECGITIERCDQREHLGWDRLGELINPLGEWSCRTDDGRLIVIPASGCSIIAAAAKLPRQLKFWTGGFVFTLLLSVLGPAGVAMAVSWLDPVPTDISPLGIYAMMQACTLGFVGLLILRWLARVRAGGVPSGQ